MSNKRGQTQDGKGVAILLLLIALFMVLYILLLPPEQREDILNETILSEEGEELDTRVLLLEDPGEVYPTKESNIKHELSSINLFIKSEPETNLLANTLTISKSWISSKPQVLTFDVDDVSNLKDILLFFSVMDSKGNLVVRINNYVIFDGSTSSIETITLPVNYIQKNNKLEIKSSSTGFAFWSKNFHVLDKVGIKETYQVANPKEERIFSLPKYEANSLESAKLKYQIYCNKLSKDNTNLKIFLNNHNILDKLVACIGSSEAIEVDKGYFKEGSNRLEFTIGDGDFQFSRVEVETSLKEKVYPTYHFNIEGDDFDFIEENLAEVNLKLNFKEEARKRARILVNNKELIMDTAESEFSKEITSFVEEGDNLIKIVPQSTFYINTLEVKLEED